MGKIVLLIMMILFSACDDLLNDSVTVEGCTDNTACNFNPEANIQVADSCIYIEDCNGDCGGDTVVDSCGVCDGDNSTCNDCLELYYDCGTPVAPGNPEGCWDLIDDNCTCDDGEGSTSDECGVCNGDGIADGACDCDGNVEDCAGECGGSAELDECGECGGDSLNEEGYHCGDIQVLQDIMDANNITGLEPLEFVSEYAFDAYNGPWISGQRWNEDGRLTRLLFAPQLAGNYGMSIDFNIIPESIGNLIALDSLGIFGHYSLQTLPESIGNLSNLIYLGLDWTPITSLPESISDLQNLEVLSARLSYDNTSGLTSLPENIGNLSSLRKLDLFEHQLTSLPESICDLTSFVCIIQLGNNNLCAEYWYSCLGEFPSQDLSSPDCYNNEWECYGQYWENQNVDNCCEGLNEYGQLIENWEECP